MRSGDGCVSPAKHAVPFLVACTCWRRRFARSIRSVPGRYRTSTLPRPLPATSLLQRAFRAGSPRQRHVPTAAAGALPGTGHPPRLPAFTALLRRLPFAPHTATLPRTAAHFPTALHRACRLRATRGSSSTSSAAAISLNTVACQAPPRRLATYAVASPHSARRRIDFLNCLAAPI